MWGRKTLSVDGCANLLLRGDREKFLATTFTPIRVRRVLFPIFAFNLEMSRIAWEASDPALAEIKLKWWENELFKIFDTGNSHKHEILNALSDVILLNKLPLDLFLAIIDARRFDIYYEPHDSLANQIVYIDKIFASLLELAYRGVVEEIDDHSITVVRNFGFALGVANLMTATPNLISKGKSPFYRPEKELTEKLEINLKSHYLLEAIEVLSKLGLESLMSGRREKSFLKSPGHLAILCSCSSFLILKKAIRAPEKVLEGQCKISSNRRIFDLLCGRLLGKI